VYTWFNVVSDFSALGGVSWSEEVSDFDSGYQDYQLFTHTTDNLT
jgi:hypothetical protein